jgi:hypothetical protein
VSDHAKEYTSHIEHDECINKILTLKAESTLSRGNPISTMLLITFSSGVDIVLVYILENVLRMVAGLEGQVM